MSYKDSFYFAKTFKTKEYVKYLNCAWANRKRCEPQPVWWRD